MNIRSSLRPRMHVLASKQFRNQTFLFKLFKTTTDLIDAANNIKMRNAPVWRSLQGGVMYESFYEPSTRTISSFWMAADMLGMHIFPNEAAGNFSSAVKGESLEHTIHVLAGQNVHVIVLRHPDNGAAERAAAVATKYYPGKVAIVNGGDGSSQHPTQGLLDMFTIWRRFPDIHRLRVVIGGDLANGRTCRSLAYHLSAFPGVQLIFVAPPELQMKEDILAHLNETGIVWRKEKNLARALREADVVYWTRTQKERHKGQSKARYLKLRDTYHIGMDEMALLQSHAILMHPLPIDGEISSEVDDHPRAVYFEQADNGPFVRAALLLDIFGYPRDGVSDW